ncbi:hypothetical protein N9D18_00540 [bacterium]|nr:hypothetical protein [bacterium]
MINLVSYFEIGGKIIETGLNIEEALLQQYLVPGDILNPIPEKKDVVFGVAATAVAKVSRKENYDIGRAMRAPRRYTQARNAISLAAMLAAGDGPLPVGDVLAIGVLTGFAVYQGVQGIRDIVQ